MDNYPFLDRSFIRNKQRFKRAEDDHVYSTRHEVTLGHLKIVGMLVGGGLSLLILPIAFILAMMYAPIIAVISIGAISLWIGLTIGKRSRETYKFNLDLRREKMESLAESSRIGSATRRKWVGEDKPVRLADVIHINERKRSSLNPEGKVEKSIEGIHGSNNLGY